VDPRSAAQEDHARLGLAVAVDGLRDALVENDLLLPGDEQLLAGVLGGHVSGDQFANALCSMKGMGFPGGATH
jgi:hypothetical protein